MADQIVSLPNETGTRRAHENIPDRGDDWVLSGCNFVADFATSELKVTRGELLIADSGTLYWVKRGTTTGLSFGGGTSSVYYVIDTSGSTPTGSVQVGGSPSQPYLELGTVDASGQTTSTSNRDPTYNVINSERQTIKGRKIVALGGNGNALETFDPADYSDYGAAINAATDTLPQHGDQNARYGTVLLPELEGVDFSTTINAYDNLTIRGQGSGATALNYTGTGNGVEDVAGSSGTRNFSLTGLTINAPSGTAVWTYQLKNSVWRDFNSDGGGTGTTGVEIQADLANAGPCSFFDCQIKGYDTCWFAPDLNDTGKELALSSWHDCSVKSSAPGSTGFEGAFTSCSWYGGDCHEIGDSTFKFLSGSRLQVFNFHNENTGNFVHADNLSGTDVLVLGGFKNGNSSISDPNNVVTSIGVSGAADVLPDWSKFERFVELTDEDGDNESGAIRFQGAGDIVHFFKESGGLLRFRNINQGANILEINPSGGVDLKTNPLSNVSDLNITEQDLSQLSLAGAATGRMYRHDGSNSISADGGSTSSAGYYVWDNDGNEFKSVVQF